MEEIIGKLDAILVMLGGIVGFQIFENLVKPILDCIFKGKTCQN